MPSRSDHGLSRPGSALASSSSPSSSGTCSADYSLTTLRLNRALLAGNRTSPGTPVVTWNSLDGPSHGELDCPLMLPARRSITVSARKVAANVWDLRQGPSHACQPLCRNQENKLPSNDNQLHELDFSPAISCVSHRSCARSSSRNNKAKASQLADFSSSASEVNLRASSRFIKTLNQTSNSEDKNTCALKLASALNVEVNRTSEEAEQLFHEQKSQNKKTEETGKGLRDRKLWLHEDQDNLTESLWFIKEELEAEKNSRKRLESLYREATQDIIDLKATLAKIWKDHQKERRARELWEVAFDDLVGEAGGVEASDGTVERKAQVQTAEGMELEGKDNGLEKLRRVQKAILKAKKSHVNNTGMVEAVQETV